MLGGEQAHRPSGKRVRLGLQHSSPLSHGYKESKGKSFIRAGNIKPQNQEIIELRRRNQELEEE